jgi:hypothetical protein
MGNILKITNKEINLINELMNSGFKFNLFINEVEEDFEILEVKLNNLNICVDINYLIYNDEIEELRFFELKDLINYLINNGY